MEGIGGLGGRYYDISSVSFAQERIWFAQRQAEGDASSHVPTLLRLDGPLDIGALRASLTRLAARHEQLRASFPAVDGRPALAVASEAAAGIATVPLAGEACEALVEVVARPFDLARGPLWRAHLVQLDPDVHWLLLTLHDLICDAASTAILLDELGVLYAAAARGGPAALRPLEGTYAAFARWQRGRVESGAAARSVEHWLDYLGGSPTLSGLPPDRPRRLQAARRGRRRYVWVRDDVARALRQRCASNGVTLFAGLLAAFGTLLHRYSGEPDLVVGTAAPSRSWPGASTIVGPFQNHAMVRLRFGDRPTFRQLLGQVLEGLLRGVTHGEVPFELIVEALQPDRQVGVPPIFQTALTCLPGPPRLRRAGPLTISPMVFDAGTTRLDLTLSASPHDEGLAAWIEYDVDLFDAATMDAVAARYVGLLQFLTEQPDVPVTSCPLRETVLVPARAAGPER